MTSQQTQFCGLIADETPDLSARGSVHLVAGDMNPERVAKTRKLNQDDCDPSDTRRLPAGIRTPHTSDSGAFGKVPGIMHYPAIVIG